MERILAVKVRATVASFRRPLDHNYQRTLPMPPPTTLIGIAAAALELSDRQLWASDNPLRRLKVSVWIDNEPGRARDMWTVLKIKGNRIAERSPYFRELLFFPRYTLLYGGDEDLLHRLAQAFRDPAYPLSLGREDELMLVDEIAMAEAQDGDPRFEGTVLPGDIRQMKGVQFVVKPTVPFEPPLVETLPLRFRVDDRGVRHPEEIKPLSFLPLGMEMIVPTVKALQWQGRNFAWLNS
jgi:CRISPR-associated Cas5-like protein